MNASTSLKISSWSLSISCYVQFASPSQGNTWWPLCHCRSTITSRVFYKGTTFTLSYFCPSLSLSIILLRITPVTNCSQEEEVGGGWELGFWGSVLQVITFPCVKAFVFGVELFFRRRPDDDESPVWKSQDALLLDKNCGAQIPF